MRPPTAGNGCRIRSVTMKEPHVAYGKTAHRIVMDEGKPKRVAVFARVGLRRWERVGTMDHDLYFRHGNEWVA